jgi:hypothetical protein
VEGQIILPLSFEDSEDGQIEQLEDLPDVQGSVCGANVMTLTLDMLRKSIISLMW